MSVPEPPRAPPEIVNEPTVSLFAPRPSDPDEIVTAEALPSRLAEPSETVPPATVRAPASVPLRAVEPDEEVAVPAPRFAATVPPWSVYVAAVSVPSPPSEPPEIVNEPTVSLFALMPSEPEEIVTAEALPSRSAEPRFTTPPLTARSPASVPLRAVVPDEAVAAPAPRLPTTVPPWSA